MRIVIIGAGEVGAYLAQYLVAEHHNVTLIDTDPEKIERISDHLDLKVLIGSGTSINALREAEADKADLLLAMTNSPEANLLAAYSSKRLGTASTIARISSDDHAASSAGFYRQHLGIDLVINPSLLTAAEATAVIQAGCGSGIREFGFGRIHFRPFEVYPDSPFTTRPISELHLPGAMIAAMVRDGEVLVPRGDDVIQAHDRLVVICKPEAIRYVQKGVGERKDHVRRIIIVGGGDVGAAIAQYFDTPRYRVKLFEYNRRRAWQLADELNHIKIIDDDGADIDVLDEEYLSTAEAFVAATGSDETNLMAAVLAREHGVKHTIAIVDKPQFTELGKKLSITATLSPRLLAANQVMAFVHGGGVNRVALVAEGQAEIIEFQASASFEYLDQQLSEIDWPRGVRVGALIRGDKAVIPKGDDVIQEGDSVVLFAVQKLLPYVEAMLARNKEAQQALIEADPEPVQ